MNGMINPTTPAPAHPAAVPPRAEPMKPGEYLVKAVQVEFSYAKTGTQQAAVVVEVVDGPSTGTQEILWLYFTDGTFKGSFDALKALGWDGGSPETIIEQVSAGRAVAQTTAKFETYNNETKLKLDGARRPGSVRGIPAASVNQEEMPAFLNSLEGFLGAYQETRSAIDQGPGVRALIGQNGAKIGPAPGAPPADDGDNIPF